MDGSCSGSTAVTAVRRRQVSSQGSEVPLQVLPCQFQVTKEWITEDDEEWVQEIFDGMGNGNGVEREGW